MAYAAHASRLSGYGRRARSGCKHAGAARATAPDRRRDGPAQEPCRQGTYPSGGAGGGSVADGVNRVDDTSRHVPFTHA